MEEPENRATWGTDFPFNLRFAALEVAFLLLAERFAAGMVANEGGWKLESHCENENLLPPKGS